MIGLLVVTHGDFGRQLINALEMICGPQTQAEGVNVEQQDDMPTAAHAIEKAFERVSSGEGVIIFTDLLGGTPSNVSLTFLNKPNVEVVSGVNLPMLLKAAALRASHPLPIVVEQVLRSGQTGITSATGILGIGQKKGDHEPGAGPG